MLVLSLCNGPGLFAEALMDQNLAKDCSILPFIAQGQLI